MLKYYTKKVSCSLWAFKFHVNKWSIHQEPGRIRAADRFKIPAHTEMIIDVFIDRLDGDDDLQQMVILEPSIHFQEKYDLIMAASLSDMKSRVTHSVRLLNSSSECVSVNQDVTLGMAEEVDFIVNLTEVENQVNTLHCQDGNQHGCSENGFQQHGVRRINESSHNIIPPHLLNLFQKACTDRN